MAQTAEKVVVTIETQIDKVAAKSAEAQFDQSMNRISASAGKAEAAVTGASTKMGSSMTAANTAAGRLGGGVAQMSAMLAAGRAPMVNMTEQAVAMAGAIGGSGAVGGAAGGGVVAGVSRLIGLLGNPWVGGLMVAGLALTQFIGKQKDESATLDEIYEKLVKSKAQTALNAQADERWSHTIDALTSAILRQNAAMKKRLQTDQEAEAAAVAAAQREGDRARNGIALGQRQLAEQQRILGEATSRYNEARTGRSGGTLANQQAQMLIAKRDMDAASARISQLQGAIANLSLAAGFADETAKMNRSLQIQREVKESLDPVVAATRKYEDAVSDLTKKFDLKNISEAKYREGLRDEALKLEAVQKAQAKVRGSAGSGSGLFGNQVDQGDAAAIARRAGFQVNSSERSTARQRELYNAWIAAGKPADRPVAAPGTSAHEPGGAKWALDIQLIKGVTPDSIRKAFAEEGVKLTKLILEHGGRVAHIEGMRPGTVVQGERTAERDAARAVRDAERAAEEKRQQDERFAAEMRDLDDKLIEASAQRVTTMEAQLKSDQDAVDRATEMANAAYLSAAAEGSITEAQAKLLIEKNKQLGSARKMSLLADDLERQGEVERALAMEVADQKIAEAQTEVDNAKTAKERLAASERLLDLQIDRERLELQAILIATKDGSTQHEIAEHRLAQLERMKEREREEIRRDPANKSPLDQYREDIHKTAAEIDEDMERITVDGLEALNDGLAEAIMGTKSLGEVFNDVAKQIIAALIKIAIQQMIIKPLADILGGGMSGGGGGGYTGVAGSILGIFGGLFGGGKASGGPVRAGTAYWVGENGPEPFIPNQNGYIMPNSEAVKLAGQGGGQTLVTSLTVNAPGATAETVAMIRRELANAAPTLIAASQRTTIQSLTRTRT